VAGAVTDFIRAQKPSKILLEMMTNLNEAISPETSG